LDLLRCLSSSDQQIATKNTKILATKTRRREEDQIPEATAAAKRRGDDENRNSQTDQHRLTGFVIAALVIPVTAGYAGPRSLPLVRSLQ
jgi:hypothetical protein